MATEERFGRRNFLKRSAGICTGFLASGIFGCNPDLYNQLQSDNADKESSLEKGLSSEWEQIARLNIPRQHFGAEKMRVLGLKKRKILAIGGLDDRKRVLGNIEIYDPYTNSWSIMNEELNIPRYYFRSAADNRGRIYAVSGIVNTNGELTETVERFNPRMPENGWEFVAPVNTPRGGAQTVPVHGKIYSISGIAEGNIPVNTVEAYNSQEDRWDYIEGLNLPRAFFGAGVDLKGRIYVFGGDCSSDGGKSFYHTDTTEMFDTSKPEKGWRFAAPLSEAKSVGASATVNNLIFCVGGWKDYGHISRVEVYDAKKGSWSYHSDMPTPRNHLTALIIENQLYALGGDGTSFLSVNNAERTRAV